jgi:ABC-type sulfate/molybdate transport systems ATPase subunit
MAFQKPSAPPAFREGRLADRQVGSDLEPTLLDVDEEFAPALCALPHPGLEAVLVISGASGSGKSSLLRAGLIGIF